MLIFLHSSVFTGLVVLTGGMNHKLTSRQRFAFFFVENLGPNGFCKIDQGKMQHEDYLFDFHLHKNEKIGYFCG